MTGREFWELTRSWKKVDSIDWDVKGDPFNADCVNVIVSADGKEVTLYVGRPAVSSRVNWFNAVCIYLVVNKVLALAGRKNSFSVVDADRQYIQVTAALQTAIEVIIDEQKQQKSENLADDCGN